MLEEEKTIANNEAHPNMLSFFASFKSDAYMSLFRGCSHAGEKEELVFQTIQASHNNYNETGEAFSVLNVKEDSHAHASYSSSSYKYLVEIGIFQEKIDEDTGVTKVYPTSKLAFKLFDHFKEDITSNITMDAMLNNKQSPLTLGT